MKEGEDGKEVKEEEEEEISEFKDPLAQEFERTVRVYCCLLLCCFGCGRVNAYIL